MKFLILLSLFVFSYSAFSYNCPTSLTLLAEDASSRDKCIGKMTSHYIEEIEVRLLKIYKDNLARVPSATTNYHLQTLGYAGTKNLFELLVLLHQIRHVKNWLPKEVRISNASDLTCSSSSDSSS